MVIENTGYDLRAEIGTPVFNMHDGVVDKLYNKDTKYAKYVSIKSKKLHGFGSSVYLNTRYFHLSEVKVKVGYEIKAGTVIGLSGNSGRFSTAPHLHVEARLLNTNLKVLNYDNGYHGFFDFDELMIDRGWSRLPVEKRYNRFYIPEEPNKRPWHAYLNEIKVAGYLWKKLKRRPTWRQINACVYGAWRWEDVANPALFPIWGALKKTDYKAGKKPPIRLSLDSN